MKDNIPILENTISKREAAALNPLVLAFVGDGVQQLYVRTRLVIGSNKKAGELHKLATREIKAEAQAEFLERLLPTFSEEEMDVYKRARNTHFSTSAKNASIADYKKASGFEAVLGYLYLTGNHARLGELLQSTLPEDKEE